MRLPLVAGSCRIGARVVGAVGGVGRRADAHALAVDGYVAASPGEGGQGEAVDEPGESSARLGEAP